MCFSEVFNKQSFTRRKVTLTKNSVFTLYMCDKVFEFSLMTSICNQSPHAQCLQLTLVVFFLFSSPPFPPTHTLSHLFRLKGLVHQLICAICWYVFPASHSLLFVPTNTCPQSILARLTGPQHHGSLWHLPLCRLSLLCQALLINSRASLHRFCISSSDKALRARETWPTETRRTRSPWEKNLCKYFWLYEKFNQTDLHIHLYIYCDFHELLCNEILSWCFPLVRNLQCHGNIGWGRTKNLVHNFYFWL